MAENNLSIRGLYSNLSAEELDSVVTEIKTVMPKAGCRIVRGALRAWGYRVKWELVKASNASCGYGWHIVKDDS